MFDRILLATDGSKNATIAAKKAADLARLTGTREIIILHVCPACTADLDPDEKNIGIAQRIVDEAKELFSSLDISVSSTIEKEYPPESTGNAIIDTADLVNADMIILGSRGLSEFKGLLLGSVSNKVVHSAKCPVLVVKTGLAEEQL